MTDLLERLAKWWETKGEYLRRDSVCYTGKARENVLDDARKHLATAAALRALDEYRDVYPLASNTQAFCNNLLTQAFPEVER